MTENKQLVLLAVVMGAVVIIAVQKWLLPSEFARVFILRKDETNSAIANVERWPLESKLAKSSMFRKKEANSSITKHEGDFILHNVVWQSKLAGIRFRTECKLRSANLKIHTQPRRTPKKQ